MKRKEFIWSGLIATGASLLPKVSAAQAPSTKKSFRFAFISDIHVKPGVIPETGMTKAIAHIQNLTPKVDFIINGGDCIMDALEATKESVQKQWELYHSIMGANNKLTVYPCIGNHDVYGWFQKVLDTANPLYGKNWA